MSPNHARSVALMLNPTTGLVSPQYHIKFNKTFKTVRNTIDPANGEWKRKTKLTASTVDQSITTTTIKVAQRATPTILNQQNKDQSIIKEPEGRDELPPIPE